MFRVSYTLLQIYCFGLAKISISLAHTHTDVHVHTRVHAHAVSAVTAFCICICSCILYLYLLLYLTAYNCSLLLLPFCLTALCSLCLLQSHYRFLQMCSCAQRRSKTYWIWREPLPSAANAWHTHTHTGTHLRSLLLTLFRSLWVSLSALSENQLDDRNRNWFRLQTWNYAQIAFALHVCVCVCFTQAHFTWAQFYQPCHLQVDQANLSPHH